MTTLHETALAAESKGREVSSLLDAQAVQRAADHEILMRELDRLSDAVGMTIAQILKPINPRGE